MTNPSMYGAYDLSALAARNQAAAQAGAANAGGGAAGAGAAGAAQAGAAGAPAGAPAAGGEKVPGPLVRAITTKDLEGTLQLSQQVLVIVAFHSPRSANSGILIDTLTAYATAKAGVFQLATVNTDECPDIAAAFGVTGVPAALALIMGSPVPLFQGLPGTADIETTVDRCIDAARQYGVVGILDGDVNAQLPERPMLPHHKEGQEALEKGDLETAHAEFTAAIKANPGDQEAHTALLQIELLQTIKDADPTAILDAAREAPLTDVDTHIAAAEIEVAYNRPDAGFARLLDVIRATSGDDRDKARARLVELFDVIGADDPLVKQARKALASALF